MTHKPTKSGSDVVQMENGPGESVDTFSSSRPTSAKSKPQLNCAPEPQLPNQPIYGTDPDADTSRDRLSPRHSQRSGQSGAGGHQGRKGDSSLETVHSDEEYPSKYSHGHDQRRTSALYNESRTSNTPYPENMLIRPSANRFPEGAGGGGGTQAPKPEFYVNVSDMPQPETAETERPRRGQSFWVHITVACIVCWLCGVIFGAIALVLAS